MIPIICLVACVAAVSAEPTATSFAAKSTNSRDFEYNAFTKSKTTNFVENTSTTPAQPKPDSRHGNDPNTDSQTPTGSFYKTKYAGEISANSVRPYTQSDSPSSGTPFADYAMGSGRPGSPSSPNFPENHAPMSMEHGKFSSDEFSAGGMPSSFPGFTGSPQIAEFPGGRPPFLHGSSSPMFSSGGPYFGSPSFSHGERIVLPPSFKNYPMSSFPGPSKYSSFGIVPKTRTYPMPYMADPSSSASQMPSFPSSGSSFFSPSMSKAPSSSGPFFFNPTSQSGSPSLYSKNYPPMRLTSGYGGATAASSPGKIVVVRDSSAGHANFPPIAGLYGTPYRARITGYTNPGSSPAASFMTAASNFFSKGLASTLFGE